MLIIRKAQVQALERAPLDRFIREVAAYLRAEHRGLLAGVPEAAVYDRVEDAIARGRRYGVARKASLQRFVVLSFRYGPRFDEHALLRPFLEDWSKLPDDRIDALGWTVPPAIWGQVTSTSSNADG